MQVQGNLEGDPPADLQLQSGGAAARSWAVSEHPAGAREEPSSLAQPHRISLGQLCGSCTFPTHSPELLSAQVLGRLA